MDQPLSRLPIESVVLPPAQIAPILHRGNCSAIRSASWNTASPRSECSFSRSTLRRVATALFAAAGLVTLALPVVAPAAGFVDASGALWIRLIGGFACYIAAVYVKRIFRYDDSLDAFGIHGVGGVVGAILTGVFATSAVNGGSGLVDGNPGLIWVQLQGLGATIAYFAVATWLILKVIDVTIGLRVSREQEIEGLDLHLHGETAQG